jgi:hypothetical protein
MSRGLVDAEGAQEGDVTRAGGLREIQEARHLVGEVRSYDRRDEVDAVDVLEGEAVSPRLVPVEVHIGTVARRCADAETELPQFARDPGAGLSGAGEHECLGRCFGHDSILPAITE